MNREAEKAALEDEKAASAGCYRGDMRIHSFNCSGKHPRYAVVTALGWYSGPDTYVHAVFGTLGEAQHFTYGNPRLAIVQADHDEDYMVPGYRFALTRDMLIRKAR